MAILAARRGQHAVNLQKCCARGRGVGFCRSLRAQRTREQHGDGGASKNPQTVLNVAQGSHDLAPAVSANSLARIGSRRMRFPVAAKIALASAGATGGTPGSPTPVGFTVLGTMCTSIFGDSKIRSI